MVPFSVHEIKLIIASRAPIQDAIGIGFRADSGNEMIDIQLFFVYWPQFKTYIAFPAIMTNAGWAFIAHKMPDKWHRYLKRELRQGFGVRHLHRVNIRDNSKRIEILLGLQYVAAHGH